MMDTQSALLKLSMAYDVNIHENATQDTYQMAADTDDLDNAWFQSGPDLCTPQTLTTPCSTSAVV